jgi:hypothetical protein
LKHARKAGRELDLIWRINYYKTNETLTAALQKWRFSFPKRVLSIFGKSVFQRRFVQDWRHLRNSREPLVANNI